MFPPQGDIRGLRTPAEGMSVARMVVIRCFCVSAFGELRRLVFARRDREDQIPVARALLSSTAPSRSKDRDSELEARHSRVAFWRKSDKTERHLTQL